MGRAVGPVAQIEHGLGQAVELDYWFVTSTQRRAPRKVSQFRDWLMDEITQ